MGRRGDRPRTLAFRGSSDVITLVEDQHGSTVNGGDARPGMTLPDHDAPPPAAAAGVEPGPDSLRERFNGGEGQGMPPRFRCFLEEIHESELDGLAERFPRRIASRYPPSPESRRP